MSLSELLLCWWMALDKVVTGVKCLRCKVIVSESWGTIFRLASGHDVITVRAAPNGSRIMYCRA